MKTNSQQQRDRMRRRKNRRGEILDRKRKEKKIELYAKLFCNSFVNGSANAKGPFRYNKTIIKQLLSDSETVIKK